MSDGYLAGYLAGQEAEQQRIIELLNEHTHSSPHPGNGWSCFGVWNEERGYYDPYRMFTIYEEDMAMLVAIIKGERPGLEIDPSESFEDE